MKKLLALLALAGFTSAFAQSSIQLFGNIDQTLYRGTYDGKTISTMSSNAGTTSFWGLKGSENLGGGTAVGFELRSEVSLNQGTVGSATTGISGTDSRSSSIFNRGAFIELTNTKLGGVRVGRQASALYDASLPYNNTGLTSFGFANAQGAATISTGQHLLYNGTDLSAAGKALNYMGAATGNPAYSGTAETFVGGFSYTSPTINGVTARVQTGSFDTSYTTPKGANNMVGASLDYKANNLQLTYALDVRNDSNSNSAFTQRLIGAKYNLAGYNLIAARNYTSFGGLAAAQGGHNMTLTGLGVGKSLGRWDVNLGYTVLKDDTNSDNQFKQTAVVGRYNFTKQTSWYVGLGRGQNNGASRLSPIWAPTVGVIPVAGDTGRTVNAMLTGIRYTF